MGPQAHRVYSNTHLKSSPAPKEPHALRVSYGAKFYYYEQAINTVLQWSKSQLAPAQSASGKILEY